jgi:glycerol uptake facilitator-like aquaporin
MTKHSLSQKMSAELVGTAFLLATIVGSGIMAEGLAGGNSALALLGNTVATGAMLFVLITAFGPVSGAHFNPVVTMVFALRREITPAHAALFIAVQIIGAVIGVWAAHGMFDVPILQVSEKIRTGAAQVFSETVATFGLVFTILAVSKAKESAVAMAVALYITAAYWFTASTSFANPAVTIARSLSNSFAGIRPADVSPFIAAQIISAALAWLYCHWQLSDNNEQEP